MDLVLQRLDSVTKGLLSINGAFRWFTLEREPGVRIPAGVYPVRLTVSNRAKQGSLWTPDLKFLLPEILSVPGRTGIRFHAANLVSQLEGCVAVGTAPVGDTLVHSRVALTELMHEFARHEYKSLCNLTVLDPKETK